MNDHGHWRALGLRWLKFNLVGGVGIALQLALLAVFTSAFRMPYLAATGLAVELTVLHNFAWHERYTWHTREGEVHASLVARLARFHLGNGVISLGGNLVLMKLLVGLVGMTVLAANLGAITVCALANFALAERWVFAVHAGEQCALPAESTGCPSRSAMPASVYKSFGWKP